MKKRTIYSIVVGVVLTLTACTKDLADAIKATDNIITFTATIDNDTEETRTMAIRDVMISAPVRLEAADGTPLYLHTFVEPCRNHSTLTSNTRGTAITEATLTDFGVSGHVYTTTPASTNANFFENAHVMYDNVTGKWQSHESYYFPTGSDKLAFYAYYPYYKNGATDNPTDVELLPDAVGNMKLRYTINTDWSAQSDLITAYKDGLDFNWQTPVPLHFTHALTQVNIELAEDIAPGYINLVSFEQIATTGTYEINRGWTIDTQGDITFDFTAEGGLSTLNGQGTEVARNLFMIPQSFNTNPNATTHQQMTISINDGEQTHPLTEQLTTPWQPNTVVTYQISTSSINYVRVEDVTYPEDWGGTAFPFKDAYSDGAEMGVYVTDASGKVITANVKITYDESNSRWTMDRADRSSMAYDPTYHYYAYYPYHATISGGHVINDNVTAGTTAEDFFASVLTNWTVTADQSTAEKLLPNDLHICKATTGTHYTQMHFPMQHAMGLAKISLGAANVTTKMRHYTLGSNTYTEQTVASTLVTASNNFGTNKPCKNASYYYFITKANTLTEFSATPTNSSDGWKAPIQATIDYYDYKLLNVDLEDDVDTKSIYYKTWDVGFIDNTIQEFTAGEDGVYKLQVWGAQGGSQYGALGGYSEGEVTLNANDKLYICIGGQGGTYALLSNGGAAGYNGGGKGGNGNYWSGGACNSGTGGGGATHIAKVTGELKLLEAQKDEVIYIVAGGGGGYNVDLIWHSNHIETSSPHRGYGGGLEGGIGITTWGHYTAAGGTQTSGYAFGQGQDGRNGIYYGEAEGSGGGGGGWYGGFSYQGTDDGYGAGGSGYIGGVDNGETIAGNEEFPSPSGGLETGHAGNGAAVITFMHAY